MAKKKKLLTAVVAVATAAALMLGGTFAWQSINQTALNEASDVINPGGRLHDDFDGTNKDVYVENFADEDIFARIRLEEYFEIVLNYNTAGEKTETILGGKNDDGTYNYALYKFDGNVDAEGAVKAGIDASDSSKSYWTWQTGGSTVYMPTFNMNKDSLQADINGNYVDAIGGISNRNDPDRAQYENYKEYTEGEDKDGKAIYDIDANTADELAQGGVDIADLIDNGTLDTTYEGNVTLLDETHEAKPTGNGTLISMTDWLAMVEENGEYDATLHGNYWVYDTDGWVYWSAPIPGGEATGLLLDGIELNGVMDDTWYYAINVVAQFVTANDTGSVEDGTGFYDTANGTVPSDNALTLLDKIGINDTTPGTDEDPTDPDELQTLILTTTGDSEVTIAHGDSVKIEDENGDIPSSIRVDGSEWSEDSDWIYDPDTGILILSGYDSYYDISDAGENYSGTVYFEDDSSDPDQYYTMHIYFDPVDQDADHTSYLIPGVEYRVEVAADANEYNDTSVALSLETEDGTVLTAGTDYEVDSATVAFEPYAGEYGTDYAKQAIFNLTILNTDLVGEIVYIRAVADQTGNDATNETSVNYKELEVNIKLYSTGDSGTVVAGTGGSSTIAANSTYDVVGTITADDGKEYVVYSSNSAIASIPDNIEIKHDGVNYIIAHGNVEHNDINEKGQLYVGAAEQFAGTTEDNELTLSIGADSVLIYESAESKANGEDPLYTYHVYNQWNLYPNGQEVYSMSVASGYTEMEVSARGENQITMTVEDGNHRDITAKDSLTYSITGNTSDDTTVTLGTDDEGEDIAILTIGKDETATELTITASDANGSDSETVTITYMNYLTIGSYEPSDQWNGIYVYSSDEAYDAELVLRDYWGNPVSGVTWTIENALSDETAVNGDTLTIGAEEDAWPATLTATESDGTTTTFDVCFGYQPGGVTVEITAEDGKIGVSDSEYLTVEVKQYNAAVSADNYTVALSLSGSSTELLANENERTKVEKSGDDWVLRTTERENATALYLSAVVTMNGQEYYSGTEIAVDLTKYAEVKLLNNGTEVDKDDFGNYVIDVREGEASLNLELGNIYYNGEVVDKGLAAYHALSSLDVTTYLNETPEENGLTAASHDGWYYGYVGTEKVLDVSYHDGTVNLAQYESFYRIVLQIECQGNDVSGYVTLIVNGG